MQFFDLNIVYLEGDKSIPDKSAKKQNRLRLIIKAMELGYTGIAYNRTIKGAMSESDRCSIPPFPLSSLLNVAPSLSSAVSFHRRLLGVPATAPFRQYTRLTVVVETSAQASALNSGNPVLKTYDLVAVRPLNQNCFDHACQSSQVDLISIHFAEKLPFRLKLPMVKAAIARGVYFEITYSSLMEDVQARRQLIANAKLLVEWTRGKNLIVSSAASSVLELRGPNDVSNLSSLLGLPNEPAKAAISKNCRLLIANALRKRQFYKEAIRVEVMPAGAQNDPNEPWVVDNLDWDPISSGEGDLCLDDMAKSFANPGKVSQTVKAIDFTSIVNSAQSHGLQVKDIGFPVADKLYQYGDVINLASKNLEVSKDTEKLQKSVPLSGSQLDSDGNADEKSQQAMLLDSPKALPVHEELRISSTIFLQEEDKADGLEGNMSVHEPELQKDCASHAEDMLISNIRETPPEDFGLDDGRGAYSKEEGSINFQDVDGSRQLVSDVMNSTEAGVSTSLQLSDQSNLSVPLDTSLNGHSLPLMENAELDAYSTIIADKMMNEESFVERSGSDFSVRGEEVTEEQGQREEHYIGGEVGSNENLNADTMVEMASSPQGKYRDDSVVAKSVCPENVTVATGKQVEESSRANSHSLVENKSGPHKVKRLVSDQVYRFPFKRLLQVQFKKKGRKSTYKKKR